MEAGHAGCAARARQAPRNRKRLGAFERAKGHIFGRDVYICNRIGGNLQEQAVISAALVELAGGMQEAWPKTNSGGAAGFGADGCAQGSQRGFHLGVARQVGIDGNVVTGFGAGKEFLRAKAAFSSATMHLRQVCRSACIPQSWSWCGFSILHIRWSKALTFRMAQATTVANSQR